MASAIALAKAAAAAAKTQGNFIKLIFLFCFQQYERELPGNRRLTESRLSCFKGRLSWDEKLLQDYVITMTRHVGRHYAKKGKG